MSKLTKQRCLDLMHMLASNSSGPCFRFWVGLDYSCLVYFGIHGTFVLDWRD